VFASTNHLPDLLKIAKSCPTLKVVVSMDPLSATELSVLQAWASSVDVEILTMPDLERWGAGSDMFVEPGPLAGEEELEMKRVVTISYTSGTTGEYYGVHLGEGWRKQEVYADRPGDPKGVVLTNENLTITAISNARGASTKMNTGEEWRYLSYLPLSHM
jgi:long-chain acyl-CoA synthetase